MLVKETDYWLNAIMKNSKVKWPEHSVNLLKANLDLLADKNERKYEKVKDQKRWS